MNSLRSALGVMLFLTMLCPIACASLDARMLRLGATRRPLPESAVVTLYRPPVTTLHGRELALMELTTYEGLTPLEQVLPVLQEMARSVGASAIVWLGEYRARGFFRVIASAVAPEQTR